MTFPAYPAYKDSGVEWLDEVPDDWEVLSLRRAVDAVKTGGTPSEEPPESDISEGVPWFTPGDFNGGLILSESAKFVSDNSVKNGDAKVFPSGAVLVVSIGATIGKVGYLSAPASANQQINAVIPSSKTDGYFLAYSLSVKSEEMLYLSNASTIGIINQEKTKELWLALPPIYEQLMIARFLDHETARIDALIEEQQRLIELLKEKRQAVISHAVTKGLDPTVPMKDSGVEWLGEVPAHWVISQLKFNTSEMQTGPFGSQLHAEDYVDGGIPLVNPAHMIDGVIIPDTLVSVDEVTWQRLKRHALTEGDIIFARRGELGRCAIVTNEQDGWLCGTGSLKARLNAQIDAEYAYLLITSKGAVAELSLESKGSTMENLNTETLGRIRLPLPPVSEQKAILEYVHEVSGQFGALVDAAESGIRLITERRSALISAAVTGKIDVRGWQQPASTLEQ